MVVWIKQIAFINDAMIINWLAPQASEILDKIYFCTKCKAKFLFKEDVEEHTRQMPAHQDFVNVSLK